MATSLSHQPQTGPLVLVYSAGRAGTLTALRTLRSACPRLDVADVRTLHPQRTAEYRAWLSVPTSGDRRVREGDAAVTGRLTADPGRRVLIVTPIRDPVSAAVSSYFWNLPLRAPGVNALDLPPGRIAAEIARGDFASRPEYFTSWLEDELKAATAVDAYAKPFDHRSGHTRCSSGRFTCVIVRVEDLAKALPEALASLDIAVRGLGDAGHVGDRETYGAAYQRFRSQPLLPRTWVDEQLATRFARHFYTTEERAAIGRRWATD